MGSSWHYLHALKQMHLCVLAVKSTRSCLFSSWVCKLKTLEQVAYHLSCFEDLGWFKSLKVLQGPNPALIETTAGFVGDVQGTRIWHYRLRELKWIKPLQPFKDG